MAHLVPSQEQLNTLPTPLTDGEQALMLALQDALDDEWTIYVQPFLNGVQPDFIVFSETGGLGIFEVKDWNLNHYRIDPGGVWRVFDSKQDAWFPLKKGGPLEQVQGYRQDLLEYELPEVKAAAILDNEKYALISTFVYFHSHTTETALAKASADRATNGHQYVCVFGHDALEINRLRRVLAQGYLRHGSRFSQFMIDAKLQARLRNAMSFPEHGRLEVDDILFKLTRKQKELLSNAPGKKRVIGSAGSGKTLLIARKAVNAALGGQKVLVVCFNLTMVNYLSETISRLARYKSQNGLDIRRNILVRHYHRLFRVSDPEDLDDEYDERPSVHDNGLGSFDTILIDEGQDFRREWIENLYSLGHDRSHVMFMEDDRQNIYDVDTMQRRSVPGIIGRPNELNRSFRLTPEVAAAANYLISLSKREFESGEMVTAKKADGLALRFHLPAWYQGEPNAVIAKLREQVCNLVETSGSGAFADMAILVCTVQDGWAVCDQLKSLRLPFICNFESRNERIRLEHVYTGDDLKRQINALRRARKMAFWMQTGRVKVCTIHSFKGWELKRVLVYFNPNGFQELVRVPLLYTAMTRAQDSLTIFNADDQLGVYGRRAAAEGLLDYRRLAPTA